MDADLLRELSGETWVASALLKELTADLPMAGSDIDLIAASRDDSTLGTVRSWLQSGSVPPWSACAALSPELRCWRLQLGNLSGRSPLAPAGATIGGFAVSGSNSRTPGSDSTVP